MAQTILLKNARLIDGVADQPRTGVSIVVTGDRVRAVEQGEIPAPAGADGVTNWYFSNLNRYPKFKAVDEQAKNKIVHPGRLRETNCFAD